MSFDENPQLNSKIDFKKYKENIFIRIHKTI